MSIEESPRRRRRSRLSAAGKRGRSAGRSSAFGRPTASVRRPPAPLRAGGKPRNRAEGSVRDNPDFECPGTPKLPVAQRGPKWHTAPQRRWLFPALRNQAIRHFRSVPKWHQNHDPKVATLCQIVAFFHDDVTSHSRAAGQPGPRAENRELGRASAAKNSSRYSSSPGNRKHD